MHRLSVLRSKRGLSRHVRTCKPWVEQLEARHLLAAIAWDAPTQIAADSDVSTSGTLLEARNFGGPDQTVNGVLFTDFTTGGDTVRLDIDPDLATNFSDVGVQLNADPNFQSGDVSMDALLNTARFKGGQGTQTVEITGLTAGTSYQLQLFYHDARFDNRTQTFTDGANDVTLRPRGSVDGAGDYVIGTFTADAATQSFSWSSAFGNTSFINAYQLRETSSTEIVQIDIKPSSSENTINLGSNGVVPVAILSSSTFDATTVVATSVELADAGVKLRGNGQPQATEKDVNNDGLIDLVVHIETDALELTEGDETATLTAETTTGGAIEGTDTVRIVAALMAANSGSGGAALTMQDVQLLRDFHVEPHYAESATSPAFDIVIADLPAGMLGRAEWLARDATGLRGRITLDATANGLGWFVDATPARHSEFARHADGLYVAATDSAAAGRYDLLTAFSHELGHLLGHHHEDDGLMATTLTVGTRHRETHEFAPLRVAAAPLDSVLRRMDYANLRSTSLQRLSSRLLADAPTELSAASVLSPRAASLVHRDWDEVFRREWSEEVDDLSLELDDDLLADLAPDE